MYAVIDTNVFVSALITKNPESPTRLVYDFIDNGEIVPLYNDDIIAEYKEVLSRPKFTQTFSSHTTSRHSASSGGNTEEIESNLSNVQKR